MGNRSKAMNIVLTCLVLIVGLAAGYGQSGAPTVITVPVSYADIQSAVDAAVAGDIVRIGAGSFEIARPIEIKEGVTIIGAGAGATILSGAASLRNSSDPERGSVIIAGDGTGIENLAIRGAGACGIYVRGPTRDVRSARIDRVLIANCVAGVVVNNRDFNSGILYFDNNTVVNCSIGVSDNDWNTVLMNDSIIANCAYGVKAFNVVRWTAEYNDVFNCNASAWTGTTPAATNFSKDPLFVNAAGGDFRLASGSPCIDAGAPDPAHNDPDGSRNDVGAFAYSP